MSIPVLPGLWAWGSEPWTKTVTDVVAGGSCSQAPAPSCADVRQPRQQRPDGNSSSSRILKTSKSPWRSTSTFEMLLLLSSPSSCADVRQPRQQRRDGHSACAGVLRRARFKAVGLGQEVGLGQHVRRDTTCGGAIAQLACATVASPKSRSWSWSWSWSWSSWSWSWCGRRGRGRGQIGRAHV